MLANQHNLPIIHGNGIKMTTIIRETWSIVLFYLGNYEISLGNSKRLNSLKISLNNKKS